MGEIRIRNLTKVYDAQDEEHAPVVALQDMTLDVEDGEFACLLGPSGCGKSTFLNIACGTEAPSGGEVLVAGQPVTAPRNDVSMVFQDSLLLPWRTVEENVAFGLKAQGMAKPERLAVARRYLALVGLSGFEKKFPHQLSGGMRQRVGIARALAVNPALLLMDEPFSALDAQTRNFFQEEMLRIYDRDRKTIIFVTHNINEAVFLADRVAVMTYRPGRVKAVIDIDLPRPRSLDVLETPRFAELRNQAWELIREESKKAFEASHQQGEAAV